MRQTLLLIPLNLKIQVAGLTIPVFGFGLALALWVAFSAVLAVRHYRKRGYDAELNGQLVAAAIVSGLIVGLPMVLPAIHIFGYGFAMVCGFLAGAWLAGVRAQRERLDPALMWDIGVVVLISGVIGARLFFIAEHPEDFFGRGRSLFMTLREIINLPSGGLVLYGGVLLGIAVFIGYCRMKQLSALRVADILIPSIFVGEMFGRIGCLLNGCCYGAATTLPWGIQFPKGSIPYMQQVQDGVITASAVCSQPLHPTQIYSSLIALGLAIVTWHYFPRRSRDGSVLLLGWLLYPIARFCIEILRNDTPDYVWMGIPLTIAQWVSLGMLVGAGAFAFYLSFRPKLNHTALAANANAGSTPGNGAAPSAVSGGKSLKNPMTPARTS